MSNPAIKARELGRGIDAAQHTTHATYEEFEATDTGSVIVKFFRSNGTLIAQREIYAIEEADQFIDRFAVAAHEARAALRKPAYARRG